APADAPWRDQLSALLTQARAEGVPTAGPPPAEEAGPMAALPLPPAGEGMPGDVDPDAAAAVAAMTPEERMAFMLGRVEALETRLLAESGPVEDWARLVRAYAVLGRMEDARRIYDASQDVLEGAEAGFVREQALVDGVIER
ncbi:MAG: hypothetical protein AAFV86_24975, partial [Pseudomonadota bacterium]